MNAVTEIRAAGSRDETFQQFEVTPATPVLGAYISDLHLADISEAAAEELRQALWRYGVLFLRNQQLTPAQLSEVGGCSAPSWRSIPSVKHWSMRVIPKCW